MNASNQVHALVLAGVTLILAACATTTQMAPIESRQAIKQEKPATPAGPGQPRRMPEAVGPPTPETQVFALPDDEIAPMAPVPGSDGAVVLPVPAAPPVDPALRDLVAQADRATARSDNGAARATLERALRIKPADPDLWLRLGELNLNEGEFEQALVMSQRARDLARGNAAFLARADVLAKRAQAALNR